MRVESANKFISGCTSERGKCLHKTSVEAGCFSLCLQSGGWRVASWPRVRPNWMRLLIDLNRATSPEDTAILTQFFARAIFALMAALICKISLQRAFQTTGQSTKHELTLSNGTSATSRRRIAYEKNRYQSSKLFSVYSGSLRSTLKMNFHWYM